MGETDGGLGREEASVLLALSLQASICVYIYCGEYMIRLNMEDNCRWRGAGHVCPSVSVQHGSEQYRTKHGGYNLEDIRLNGGSVV